MICQWQQKILVQCIGNVLGSRAVGGDWLERLIGHIAEERLLGDAASRQCKKLMGEETRSHYGGRRHKEVLPNRAKARTILEKAAQSLSVKLVRARPDAIEKNLRVMASAFELDALGIAMLRLFLLPMVSRHFRELVECFSLAGYGDDSFHSFVAALLDCDVEEVTRHIGPQGVLLERGLVILKDSCHRSSDFTDAYGISPQLVAALLPPVKSYDAMMQIVLGSPARPSTQWDDFEHLGEQRDRLGRLLREVVRRRETGINILFYGPPGTGKTEFSSVLAEAVGANLYPVGETREPDRWRGHDPDRFDRLLSLRLTQKMLARDPAALILFDEMEDVVERPSPFLRQVGSRIYLHRLLENNPTPTIWTCNDVAGLPEPVLRRMTMAVEVRAPSAIVRRRVWKRILERHNVVAEEALVHRLAVDFDAAPGLAEQAVRACQLSGESPESLPDFVRGLAKAMRGGRDLAPIASAGFGQFDPGLANADLDPEVLLERLTATGLGAYSLCLSGPPGTGKTAFATELANRLGAPVLRKRASDLLSKWVGGSERNIADAFAEARDGRAVLVIDEADSLLGDRRDAVRSWEITQVNEMLTWMEVHPLPFVCTTNLVGHLDAASLRRFTFKLEFGYLRRGQVEQAFRHAFSLEAPKAALALDCLTPGDFAVVKRKAGLLGRMDDPIHLADLLAAEVAAKTGRRPAFGFALRL